MLVRSSYQWETEVLQVLWGGKIPEGTESGWALAPVDERGPVPLGGLLSWGRHPHLGASGANTWDGDFEFTRRLVPMCDGNYFFESDTRLHLAGYSWSG